MEIELIDDGTMDTVFLVEGQQVRYEWEYASAWRNKDGELDMARFVADNYYELRQYVST